MKRHGLRSWLLLVIAVVLVGAHGIILYYVSSHLALSLAAVSGVIILLAIKHLALLGPFFVKVRRRFRD